MTLSLRTFKKLKCLRNLHRFINCAIKVCAQIFRETISSIIPRYKDISEEIVLISGGGRGIGRQIALEFANYKPKHVTYHFLFIQDYFSSYEMDQSVGGAKTGESREKPPGTSTSTTKKRYLALLHQFS